MTQSGRRSTDGIVTATQPGEKNADVGALPSGPPWRVIIAAIFGALVLVGFFYIAILSANQGSQVACNAFYPLTVFFALGTALAGAFIGGEIGVKGNLPIGAFGYAAIGGIAGLITVFMISWAAYGSFCGVDKSLQVEIQDIPRNLVATDLPSDFWVQKKGDDVLAIRFEPYPSDYRESSISLKFDEYRTCKISIVEYVQDQHSEVIVRDRDAYLSENWSGNKKLIVKFNSEYVGGAEEVRGSIQNCLQFSSGPNPESSSVANRIASNGTMLILNRLQISPPSVHVPNSPPSIIPSPIELDESDAGRNPPRESFSLFNWLVPTPAFAGVGGLQPLLDEVGSSDQVRADAARRRIAAEREIFAPQLLERLRDPKSSDLSKAVVLDLLVSIINMDQEELKPGSGIRDLTKGIRMLEGSDYDLIVSLLDSNEPSLRFQARRFIQRFPVNQFHVSLKKFPDGNVFEQNCGRDPDFKLRYVRYGALLYYYNRIADKFYTKKMESSDIFDMDSAYSNGQDAARCLPPELQVDSAQLDYAKALVEINLDFNREGGSGEIGPEAVRLAKRFISVVELSVSNYVYPYHIIYMSLFRDGITWQKLISETNVIRKAYIAGANGLMSGDDFRKYNKLSGTEKVSTFLSPGGALSGEVDAGKIVSVLAESEKFSFVSFRKGASNSLTGFGWIHFAANVRSRSTPELIQ